MDAQQIRHIRALSHLNAYTKYCKEKKEDGKIYMAIYINNVIVHLRTSPNTSLSHILSCLQLWLSSIIKDGLEELRVKSVGIKTKQNRFICVNKLTNRDCFPLTPLRYDISIADIFTKMHQSKLRHLMPRNKAFMGIMVSTSSFGALTSSTFKAGIGFRFIDDVRDIKKHRQFLSTKDGVSPLVTNEYGIKTEHDQAMAYFNLYGKTIEEEFLSIPLHPCIFDLLFKWGKYRLTYMHKRVAFEQYRQQQKEWMKAAKDNPARIKQLKARFWDNMGNRKYASMVLMKIQQDDAAQVLRNISNKNV